MKIFRFGVLTALGILASSVIFVLHAASPEDIRLHFEAQPVKAAPLAPLFYTVELKNISGQPILFQEFSLNPLTGMLAFYVRKKGTAEFKPWGYEQTRFYILKERTLAPGEAVAAEGALLYDELSRSFPLLEPGEYEVKARFHSGADGLEQDSETVTITVVPPSAEEEQAAKVLRGDPEFSERLVLFGLRETDAALLEQIAAFSSARLGQYALFRLGEYWLTQAERLSDAQSRKPLAQKALNYFQKLDAKDRRLAFRSRFLYKAGYASGHLDDPVKAVHAYWDPLLKEFPDSPLATKAQKYLKALEGSASSEDTRLKDYAIALMKARQKKHP